MYGIMEEKHIVSNFISHLSRALVVSSLPKSPIPDIKSCLRSDPWTTPQGLSQNDSKATPAGSWNAVFSQASMHVFKGKELVHTWQRDLWISPHEMIFFEHIGVLILQRLLLLCERGGRMRMPLKDHPSHLDFLSTVTVWMSSLLCHSWLSLWGLPSPSLGIYVTWLILADIFCSHYQTD